MSGLKRTTTTMPLSLTLVACFLLLATSQYCSIVHGIPLRNSKTSPNQDADELNEYLVRHVRKETNGKSSDFEPYLRFKTKPPMELTLEVNSNHILECEVSGSPKPVIYWMKNDQYINQEESSEIIQTESHNAGQLGLSLVKSRLYLNCANELDGQATYTCVAATPFERQFANTKVTIKRPAPLRALLLNKEAEYFANQNAIDFSEKSPSSNQVFQSESTSSECVNKKSFGSPARIYFWTVTTLENIGNDGIINCRATGLPKPNIIWYGNNDKIIEPDNRKFEVLDTGDLLIHNITFEDMGKYKCVAQNRYGVDSIDMIFFYPTEPSKER